MPGDVANLLPVTLEKNQWRLARVMDVHKNLDGVVTTASVRLPSGTVYTRTLRQIALLEPSCVELEATDAVTEERAEPSSSQDKEVRSEKGFDESLPLEIPVSQITGPEDRSRSDSSPCLEMGERSSVSKYPGDGGAALSNPGPPALGDQLSHGDTQGDAREPRSKRSRQRVGYYKRMHEGTL